MNAPWLDDHQSPTDLDFINAPHRLDDSGDHGFRRRLIGESDDSYAQVRSEREPCEIAEAEISAEEEPLLLYRAIEHHRVVGGSETNIADIHGLEARGSQRTNKRARKILIDQEAKHTYPVARTSSPAMCPAA